MDSTKPFVFISYCNVDAQWLKRVKVHLRPLVRDGLLELWDDTCIQPGQVWHDEIASALARSTVAILLLSADFFASDFVANNELPPLLRRASDGGVLILPVIVHSCLHDISALGVSRYQYVNRPGRPLASMVEHEYETVLASLARTVETHSRAWQGSSLAPEPSQLAPDSDSDVALEAKREAPKPKAKASSTRRGRRIKAGPKDDVSVLTNSRDWQWVVNLSLGYSAYLNFSGSAKKMSAGEYRDLVEMVTVPSQELGLEISVLPRSEVNPVKAHAFSETIKSELRLRNTRFASAFDFLHRVFLILNHGGPHLRWTLNESKDGLDTLQLLARNSGLLDDYSRKLIKGIFCDAMNEEQAQLERNNFTQWAFHYCDEKPLHARTRKSRA